MREEFERAGYVSLPAFQADSQVAELRSQWMRFRQLVVPTLADAEVYYEDKADPSTLKQVQQLGLRDDWFRSQMRGGVFENLAAELLGEPVTPVNLQYFNKPAGVSRATPPHQDGFYFPIEPKRAVTLWLALDDVGRDQGCLCYVRGSHRDGLRHHEPSGTLGFSLAIPDYGVMDEESREVALPCRAGHLLAHDALTIHLAEANASYSSDREALGFIYYAESAVLDEAEHRRYQERLANGWRASGRI